MPKSGVYEIAKYIPLKLRRQMVAVAYRGKSSSLWPYPVCADGRCPMGWLPGVNKQPTFGAIASVLEDFGLSAARRAGFEALEEAASVFTEDWDSGHIKDLHKALGVPKAAK